MVERTEIPEPILEHHEHHAHGGLPGDIVFRRWAAIYVGVVAALLAISALGGGHVTKEMPIPTKSPRHSDLMAPGIPT